MVVVVIVTGMVEVSRKGEPLSFSIMNIWNLEIILLVSSTASDITP